MAIFNSYVKLPEGKYQYCKCFRVIQRITYVPSSKHGISVMVIHPILGIITMGILNPIDGCMTIPLYEKTNHVLTADMRIRSIHALRLQALVADIEE